jgi:hypothetical protein
MRQYGTLVNAAMVVQANHTIKAYDYTTTDPYYESTQASPLTAVEVGNGRYYFNVTTTGKYTIVVTKSDDTTQVTNIQVDMIGDDFVQFAPPE